MTRTILSEADIRKLNRDLQILLATNGTLTRILKIVTNDDIVVQIVNQQIHETMPDIPEGERMPESRILQRQTILNGRSSGKPFLAAEALIAIDFLPAPLMWTLTETAHSLGELMLAHGLEMFKETPEIWIGELPGWVPAKAHCEFHNPVVSRRYHMIIDGQSAIVLTEHFLPGVMHGQSLHDAAC
ncbi:chorismate--pyruvate lyase family protein [Mycobacterium sp. ML4]